MIGNTPLLEMSNFGRESAKATMAGKLEFSIRRQRQGRIAAAMSVDAERKRACAEIGDIEHQGNTGIGLAASPPKGTGDSDIRKP